MRGRKFLYNLLIFSAFLFGLPWIVYQVLFVKKRRKGISQRLGFTPTMDGPVIWCHAVSVGEVRAVQPMLKLLQEDERPAGRIVLSTVTPTGQETAMRECGFVRKIFFFPLDLPCCVRRAIKRVKPELFVTAETEIWPNFFFNCFRMRIPVAIVNGRISDASFSRYMKFRWFFRPIMKKVTLFLMQSEEDAKRILELGARPETVKVTGNMKYDRTPEFVSLPEEVKRWAERGFLLVAGSTHAGEEGIMIEVLKSLKDKDILLALVPRHPERFDEVGGLLEEARVSFSRFTDIMAGGLAEGEVVLVDAMGVLDSFYALADVAFVGGSLVPVGGHNLLEPAAHSVPVLMGPYYQNFRDIGEILLNSGGCRVVLDTRDFSEAVKSFKSNKTLKKHTGRLAFNSLKGMEGASKRNVSYLRDIKERVNGG